MVHVKAAVNHLHTLFPVVKHSSLVLEAVLSYSLATRCVPWEAAQPVPADSSWLIKN